MTGTGSGRTPRRGAAPRPAAGPGAAAWARARAAGGRAEVEAAGGGRFVARGAVAVPVPAAAAFGALQDYASAPDIYRNILESRVEERAGHGQVVVQRCLWRVLLFKGSFEACFEVEEDPGAGELTYRQLLDPKAFMRELSVLWTVTPAGDGACAVEHSMTVEPRVEIPAAFKKNVGALLTRQVEGILEDFTAGVLERAGGGSGAT